MLWSATVGVCPLPGTSRLVHTLWGLNVWLACLWACWLCGLYHTVDLFTAIGWGRGCIFNTPMLVLGFVSFPACCWAGLVALLLGLLLPRAASGPLSGGHSPTGVALPCLALFVGEGSQPLLTPLGPQPLWLLPASHLPRGWVLFLATVSRPLVCSSSSQCFPDLSCPPVFFLAVCIATLACPDWFFGVRSRPLGGILVLYSVAGSCWVGCL